MTDQSALDVEALAQLLSAADVHVNHGNYPTWEQLSTEPGYGRDEYRKAARYVLAHVTVAAHQDARQPAAEETHPGYDIAGYPSVHRGPRERCYDPACETDQTACRHCKGTGADPEDEGDYDPNVHMHNPTTVGPCPECHGSGKSAVGQQDATQPNTDETDFTDASTAFMQIGRTPALQGLRVELRIEGYPPLVGNYAGAGMRRLEEGVLAIEPMLLFAWSDTAAGAES